MSTVHSSRSSFTEVSPRESDPAFLLRSSETPCRCDGAACESEISWFLLYPLESSSAVSADPAARLEPSTAAASALSWEKKKVSSFFSCASVRTSL